VAGRKPSRTLPQLIFSVFRGSSSFVSVSLHGNPPARAVEGRTCLHKKEREQARRDSIMHIARPSEELGDCDKIIPPEDR
jgi:hypothetical protein